MQGIQGIQQKLLTWTEVNEIIDFLPTIINVPLLESLASPELYL